jgi:hypothetical protein
MQQPMLSNKCPQKHVSVQWCDARAHAPFADGEWETFEDCCQQSYDRDSSVPIRGDGEENYECYLAVGVMDPPCFVPDQDVMRRECFQTGDMDTCMSGGRGGFLWHQCHAVALLLVLGSMPG